MTKDAAARVLCCDCGEPLDYQPCVPKPQDRVTPASVALPDRKAAVIAATDRMTAALSERVEK